jgi:hypothetical protein
MPGAAKSAVLFLAFTVVMRLIFALTWLQSVSAAATLAMLFWLIVRSDERLARVEACLGTDDEKGG